MTSLFQRLGTAPRTHIVRWQQDHVIFKLSDSMQSVTPLTVLLPSYIRDPAYPGELGAGCTQLLCSSMHSQCT